MSLSLSGPANYNFNIQPGKHIIYVVPSSYSYTARGCIGATESDTENLSDSLKGWTWWCK